MRQLIITKNPDKKGLVQLDGKDYRYLRQVLRVKAGDMVTLRLPDGTLCDSTAAKIDDNTKKITLQVCANSDVIARSEATKQSTNEIEYSLFQFIPKPQKLELIVRQATECGVKNIIPVISEYAQKGNVQAVAGGKKERLERIVREARQQSGSPIDTTVFELVTVEQAVELWNKMKEEAGGPENAAGFVLSERDVAEEGRFEPFDKLRDHNARGPCPSTSSGTAGRRVPRKTPSSLSLALANLKACRLISGWIPTSQENIFLRSPDAMFRQREEKPLQKELNGPVNLFIQYWNLFTKKIPMPA